MHSAKFSMFQPQKNVLPRRERFKNVLSTSHSMHSTQSNVNVIEMTIDATEGVKCFQNF